MKIASINWQEIWNHPIDQAAHVSFRIETPFAFYRIAPVLHFFSQGARYSTVQARTCKTGIKHAANSGL